MIKFLKKHKLNIIISLFCAFVMAIFTFISFSCKTYAYTIDNNGNLVGDNLFNIDNLNESNLVTKSQIDDYNITSQNMLIITSNNANDPYLYFKNTIELNSGTYTFSFKSTTNIQHIGLTSNNTTSQIFDIYNTNNGYYTFTINNTTTYGIGIELYEGTTTLQIMLNNGNEALEWEPYGVWYSENNYNTLNNQYNDLVNSTSQTALQGVLDNSKIKLYNYYTNEYLNLEFTINMTNPNQFDLSQDCPSLSNWLYNYDSELDTNETYKNIHAVYELNGNYTNSFVVTFDTQVMDYQFTCYYSDGTSQLLSNTDYSYNIIANPDNKTMTSFSIDYTRPDYITTIINFGLNGYSYQYGYKEGYNKASITVGSSSYQQGYINGKDYKVSSYENQINSLNNSINTLKELNAQLREQIEDNLGWSSLFFAFADTPFKVVSNVLGFELFGVNLFATFIGMITVFGVVYLLKKFI